jgi:hypothetical protein
MQSFSQEFRLSKQHEELSMEDLDFLSNHLAYNTSNEYGYIFKRFRSFCVLLNEDPLTCSPAVIVKYLRSLYESGAQYRTVNSHRSAISKFHCGWAGIPIGKHPLMCQAVKAVFHLRPPLPKYQTTFDIGPVLDYVGAMPPYADMDLKILTMKTVFLTSFSTLSRSSCLPI